MRHPKEDQTLFPFSYYEAQVEYWGFSTRKQNKRNSERDNGNTRVTSYVLLVTDWKLKSTNWNSQVLVQIDELQS